MKFNKATCKLCREELWDSGGRKVDTSQLCAHVGQKSQQMGYTTIGSVQSQVGWNSEQADLLKNVPTHDKDVGLGDV